LLASADVDTVDENGITLLYYIIITRRGRKQPARPTLEEEEEKAKAPSVVDLDREASAEVWGQAEAEKLPGLEPMPRPITRKRAKLQPPQQRRKAANEEADAALQAALEAEPHDVDALVAAINNNVDHASSELLKEARATRDRIKKERK